MLTEEQKRQAQLLDKAIDEALQVIKHRIIVFSGKGGVGKTTVSIALAFCLQQRGYRAAILDADVTGPNVPKMLGLSGRMRAHNELILPEEKDGVAVVSLASAISPDQPVMWRGPRRSKILYQFLGGVEWGQRDFLIADLPPGTGDEVMTLAEKMKPDMAVIVTTPQEVSLVDSRRAINMARETGISKIGLIENMSGLVCPDCGRMIELFGAEGGQKQAEQMKVTFLGKLPIDIQMREMADEGRLASLSRGDEGISSAVAEIVGKME
jgi:ATP-binding protein involved in chromosome partitioning